MRPLMEDHIPSTPEEIAEFRERVDKSPNARTFLISGDETSTLINATFIEQRLDYGEAFKYVHGLVLKYPAADHDVYLSGQDRTSVVLGKCVYVLLVLSWGRLIKNKKTK